jgi:hypothetical protein
MTLETTSAEFVEYSRKGLRLSEAGPVTERRWRSWNVSRDRGKALKKFLCNLADCSDRGPPSGRRSQLAVRNSESALSDRPPGNTTASSRAIRSSSIRW